MEENIGQYGGYCYKCGAKLIVRNIHPDGFNPHTGERIFKAKYECPLSTSHQNWDIERSGESGKWSLSQSNFDS